MPFLPQLMARKLPFFYGWVILGCACSAGVARQGSSVATLSIFVEPMTSEFGWTMTAMSGAVSLGGLLAAFASPMLGPMVDRHGARVMLGIAVILTGAATLMLSQIQGLVAFYLLFCLARMNFAGPFDLGIFGAINSWFVQRRPTATAVVNLAMMIGLTAMPLIAQFAILGHGWRGGWVAVGVVVLLFGLVPTLLFMVRRPEDMGLHPDGFSPASEIKSTEPGDKKNEKRHFRDPSFTRAQAVRTPAFWMLLAYTALAYPVQAGVSLHQAPHLIQIGIDPTTAAMIIASFSLVSGISGILYAAWVRRIGVRWVLVVGGICFVGSCIAMTGITNATEAYAAAALFGVGIGGLLTVLPIAWADFFGRQNFGAIRGIALTVQVSAQAAGPVISGVLRDLTGDYVLSLYVFAALSLVGTIAILFAHPPKEVNVS
ncbi:MAG: MFS transporter [Rhodospirillaceae bacterium]|nr:MFS transporter [Rhodospirillaceae bacterium]